MLHVLHTLLQRNGSFLATPHNEIAMSATFKSLMLRATELTRSGRLSEATAAIRAALAGHAIPPVSPAAPEGRVFDMEKEALGPPVSEPDADSTLRPSPPVARPAGGQFLSGSFTAHDLTRRYKLFVPLGETTGLPLIVMLHGCTQDPNDFASGTQMNRLAEESGFLVLYPAQERNSNPNRCWNWFDVKNQSRGRGEPGLIADLAVHVADEYRLDRERIYVAGMSAGGAMAAILADEYPDVFAAAGVHSGLPRGAARNVISALSAMKNGTSHFPAYDAGGARPAPIIVFHGDADNTVNPKNGQAIVTERLRATGLGSAVPGQAPVVESVTTPAGQRCDVKRFFNGAGECVIEYWQIHGAGHTWAGGSDEGSYTDSNGPDASRIMLTFFLAHKRH